MDEIIKLLSSNLPEALKLLTANSIDPKTIEDIRDEYVNLKRDIRDTQVGNIQKDKTVGKGAEKKLVKGVRIPIPFQNKIVKMATAFEVGASVTLTPSEENDLSKEIIRLWRSNRMDNVLQKAKKLQKSELQCAILFYIKELKPNGLFNRILGKNKKKEIKSRLLKNESGTMSPYFDSFGNMTAFTWEFTTKINSKEIKHAWVYTDEKIYKASTISGTMELDNSGGEAHGFGKIPIVYLSQKQVEWHVAKPLIDRIETALSKFSASNDYTGHPILVLYGEVKGAPDKDESGKAFSIPIKEGKDGKPLHGKAEFLTYDQAPTAIKLELEHLEKYIYSLTSTPDISFNNMKGLGAISGVAIKLMFLEAMIKAKMNEGDNRTIVERMINVMIAGNVNTTNTNLKSKTETTYFDVVFNSIIPEDLVSIIEMLSQGIQSKIVSQKTAVEHLSLTDNNDKEIVEINKTLEVVEE